MCLARFSDKLMNEIKQLEERIGENVTKTKSEKLAAGNRMNDEKLKKPSPKKVIKKVVKTADGEPKTVAKKVVKRTSDVPAKKTSRPVQMKKEKSTEDILFDEVCASNSIMDDINLLERTIYSAERLRTIDGSLPNMKQDPAEQNQNNLPIYAMKPLTNSVNQLPTSTKVAPAKPVRRNKSMSSSNSPDIVPPRKNTLLGSMTKLYQTIKNAASPSSSASSPVKDTSQINGNAGLSSHPNDVDVTDGGKECLKDVTNKKILFRYKPLTVVRCATPPSIKKPIVYQQKGPQNATVTTAQNLNGVDINRHKLLERQLAVDNLNLNDHKPIPRHENLSTTLKFPIPTDHRYSNPEEKLNSLNDSEQPKRYSSNYEDAISCHYDIIGSRHQSPVKPEKPPRKVSASNERDRETDRLIERSQLIHNRKEEFMNAKLSGSNPYMKKVIDDERNDCGYGFSLSRDELTTDNYYSKSRDEPKLRDELRKDFYYGRARDDQPMMERNYRDGYNHGLSGHTFGSGSGLNSHMYGSGLNSHIYGSGGSGLNSQSNYSTSYGSSRQLSKKNSIPSVSSSNQNNSRKFTATTPSTSTTSSKYGLGIFNKKSSAQSSTNSKDNCTIS